jgi:hypothetical protein
MRRVSGARRSLPKVQKPYSPPELSGHVVLVAQNPDVDFEHYLCLHAEPCVPKQNWLDSSAPFTLCQTCWAEIEKGAHVIVEGTKRELANPRFSGVPGYPQRALRMP